MTTTEAVALPGFQFVHRPADGPNTETNGLREVPFGNPVIERAGGQAVASGDRWTA